MPPKPVCPVALAEAEAVVLMAFPCVYAGDDAARPWPFAARVRAASCPFPSELPAGARHPSAGRAFPEVETFCEALCCDQKLVAVAVSLPPTPLVRGRTPSTPTTHHPRICPPHATTRAHLVAQPDELEVVAPLVVAQPELGAGPDWADGRIVRDFTAGVCSDI